VVVFRFHTARLRQKFDFLSNLAPPAIEKFVFLFDDAFGDGPQIGPQIGLKAFVER